MHSALHQLCARHEDTSMPQPLTSGVHGNPTSGPAVRGKEAGVQTGSSGMLRGHPKRGLYSGREEGGSRLTE
jgi:hypothetical protein